MEKQRIVSGMRPTGDLHLGNYFGALENWVRLQEDYKCFYFIADWHALTTGYEDTSAMRDNSRKIVVDWLSAGLDPNKCVIFRQSEIKEHAELHLLLSMITPVSWLLRCPTYKDQLKQLKEKNIATYGFLGYPCLMSSDILIYKANAVPVGEDQLPHLELTREIARRFNFLYGEVFAEPQPLLTETKVLPGIDGRKMSKSYQNTILLSEQIDKIKKKVSAMITDPARIKKDDPGHPDICSVYAYKKIFNTGEIEEIEASCKAGKIGCVQCKKSLADNLAAYIQPMLERREKFIKTPDIIDDILRDGAVKARKEAAATLEEVRSAMKI